MVANSIFSNFLQHHEGLSRRSKEAQKALKEVTTAFCDWHEVFSESDSFVYCAGSLGRGDIGQQSDLDIFVVTTRNEKKRRRLEEIRLLSLAIETNQKLGYGEFSNDGQYLKVYSLDEMTKALGAPYDDSENLFTARMLMLLESRCVCCTPAYNQSLTRIIDHYFRDSRGKRSFRPLFLINDLLRYWRTLCLNYELIRDIPERPWRKKNINLKFSRMLTVFGTVLPVIADEMDNPEDVRSLVLMSPHQRFAKGLDVLGDDSLLPAYSEFLNDYESFLSWKEAMGSKLALKDAELDENSRAAAKRFSDFIFRAVTHDRIDSELRKYLVL